MNERDYRVRRNRRSFYLLTVYVVRSFCRLCKMYGELCRGVYLYWGHAGRWDTVGMVCCWALGAFATCPSQSGTAATVAFPLLLFHLSQISNGWRQSTRTRNSVSVPSSIHPRLGRLFIGLEFERRGDKEFPPGFTCSHPRPRQRPELAARRRGGCSRSHPLTYQVWNCGGYCLISYPASQHIIVIGIDPATYVV